MTTQTHRSLNQRALLVFVLVLALLVSAIGITVSSLQNRFLQDEARSRFHTELALLGELAVEPLLRSDYAAVERLIITWVNRRSFPLQISAVMPNGFVLAAAKNSPNISHALKVDQPVVFGKRRLLVLRAVTDISVQEEKVSTLTRNAAMVSAVLIMLLGWTLWGVLKRTAIGPLEAEIRAHAAKEQELHQRTVELETAMNELDSFSYSVSHDLRAPLRAIDGYCHILSQDYAQVLDAGAQQYLTRTRAAAQRMGQLTDDLLGLSRMARHALNMSKVDLSALAREVVDRLSQEEPQRQVKVSIADGVWAHADASLMDVVLNNLLGNAWKYTAQTADAAIAFGRIERDGGAVYFVRDNGIGFDMQFADKLFLPFQRLHGADFHGTGIGLAMVQRIIDRHGGRVWAESEPGKGTVFYFSLPEPEFG